MNENPRVELHVTDYGVITLELDEARAPLSVANFLAHVRSGNYDNTIFHRVIAGFMVQGGGFGPGMQRKNDAAQTIRNEADNGLKNAHYTLAMARTDEPHSASAQFFINSADNGFLDHRSATPRGWGYAVFGKVVVGNAVVDAIGAVKTGRKGLHDDVPRQDVVLGKALAL